MMNARGGLSLMAATWLSWMQYRGFFFLLAFMWMVPPLVSLFVWLAAAGGGSIGGMDRGMIVFYYLGLILVNQLTYAQANWTVGDAIRSGRMSALLVRPMPPLFDALASELAGKVVYMAFLAPVVAVLALILRPELNVTPRDALLFLPALACAWALRFLWGYWLALLSFWTTRADSLLSLQDSLVFLLAGQVAPVALLPGPMKAAASVLPFRSMLGFPVEVLTGRLDEAGLAAGFLFQGIWLAVAATLSAALWRAGTKRYTAVGG
jgi:ABC-2 type transport system permease protein